jgi:hypothetical protein
MRRLASLIALALALALPGVALAQSAGDEQYYDPLAGSNPAPHHSPSQSAQQQPSSAPAAAPGQPAQTGQQQTTASQSTTPQSSGNQLPRTGFPALLLAVMGAGFLLSGGTLRRGAAEPQPVEPPPYLRGGRRTRAAVRRLARRRQG